MSAKTIVSTNVTLTINGVVVGGLVPSDYICAAADPIKCYIKCCEEHDYFLCEEAAHHQCSTDHSQEPYCFERDKNVGCKGR
jgi:hypothetical protein